MMFFVLTAKTLLTLNLKINIQHISFTLKSTVVIVMKYNIAAMVKYLLR